MLMFLKKMKDKALSFSLFKQELVFFAVVFVAEIVLYLIVVKFVFKFSLDEDKILESIIAWWGVHLLFIFLFIITNFVYLFTHLSFNDKLIYSDFCKAVFALTIFGIFYFCLSFPFDWMMFMDPPKEDVSSWQYMPGGGFMMVLFSFTASARNHYRFYLIISSYCLFLLIVALINLLGWGIKEIIFLTRKRKGGE